MRCINHHPAHKSPDASGDYPFLLYQGHVFAPKERQKETSFGSSDKGKCRGSSLGGKPRPTYPRAVGVTTSSVLKPDGSCPRGRPFPLLIASRSSMYPPCPYFCRSRACSNTSRSGRDGAGDLQSASWFVESRRLDKMVVYLEGWGEGRFVWCFGEEFE